MKYTKFLIALLVFVCSPAFAQNNLKREQKILFIGNSFTYGAASGTIHYNSGTVKDLNNENIGGVPALFESFTEQAGIKYKVYLETHPGAGLDWHYNNKLSVITRPKWDIVVMHSYSTLDAAKPNDAGKLIDYSGRLARAFKARNATTEIFLTATWSRADLIYKGNGIWKDTPVEKMGQDVRAGYDLAKAANPEISKVIPVGEAWNHAFAKGVADPNPYDGIDYGKVDLWGWDSYHASNYGYYLHALVVYATITQKDPRALGRSEKSANDLGISPTQATNLQNIAYEICFGTK